MNIKEEIKKLPLNERIALLEEVWDDIAQTEELPVPEWHMQILNERIEAYNKNPKDYITYENWKKKYFTR